MANKAEDTDKAATRPSVVSAAVLRAIDACLHALQRLRSRFEVPAEDKDAKRDGGRRSQSAPELAPATEEAAPHSKGFLYRALIVLLCLLLGSAAGATLAYRVFSKKLESHATVVERIEDELDIAKKEAARSVNLMAKFQKENAEFRLEVREAQREVEDYKRRIDELEKQQAATKRIERPVSSSGRAAVPAATAKPRAPEKTGTCTVGPGNPSGSLSDCIDKFNRP